jgi:PAS domain S-box-containing protein
MTGLAGWTASAETFLGSILDCVAQPVWVVDHQGLIVFANPAAVAALGYPDLAELRGRPSHQTIHYKHPDGSPYPVEECPMLLPRTTGQSIHREDDWFVRRDGSMFPVAYWSAPIETPSGRGAVVAFTDIEVRRAAERTARERDVAQARAVEARAAQRRIIQSTDAARRRMARDLHDGAQQRLLTALVNLQLAQQNWSTEPERARRLVDLATEHLLAGVEELRELAAGIHPTILTKGGLAAAVRALASRTPIPVDVVQTPADRLPTELEANAYFVVSEALTNVVKHARASHATVGLWVEDNRLHVQISDDGVGGADLNGPGTGLPGLVDRVKALDGRLRLDDHPRGGTLLHADIPLNPSAC